MVPWFLVTIEASNSSPGSAHDPPMASQALCHGTCDGTVAISERNGSAQVGRFFAEFYFGGVGLKCLDVTLLRFFG